MSRSYQEQHFLELQMATSMQTEVLKVDYLIVSLHKIVECQCQLSSHVPLKVLHGINCEEIRPSSGFIDRILKCELQYTCSYVAFSMWFNSAWNYLRKVAKNNEN
jgi:hypothetical protein